MIAAPVVIGWVGEGVGGLIGWIERVGWVGGLVGWWVDRAG